MAGILATIDIDDEQAEAKVRGLKDALTDLLTVQQQAAQAVASGAQAINTGAAALSAYGAGASAAAEGINELTQALEQARAAAESLKAIADAANQLKPVEEALHGVAEAAQDIPQVTEAVARGLASVGAAASGVAPPVTAAAAALTDMGEASTTVVQGFSAILSATQGGTQNLSAIGEASAEAAQGLTDVQTATQGTAQTLSGIGPAGQQAAEGLEAIHESAAGVSGGLAEVATTALAVAPASQAAAAGLEAIGAASAAVEAPLESVSTSSEAAASGLETISEAATKMGPEVQSALQTATDEFQTAGAEFNSFGEGVSAASELAASGLQSIATAAEQAGPAMVDAASAAASGLDTLGQTADAVAPGIVNATEGITAGLTEINESAEAIAPALATAVSASEQGFVDISTAAETVGDIASQIGPQIQQALTETESQFSSFGDSVEDIGPIMQGAAERAATGLKSIGVAAQTSQAAACIEASRAAECIETVGDSADKIAPALQAAGTGAVAGLKPITDAAAKVGPAVQASTQVAEKGFEDMAAAAAATLPPVKNVGDAFTMLGSNLAGAAAAGKTVLLTQQALGDTLQSLARAAIAGNVPLSQMAASAQVLAQAAAAGAPGLKDVASVLQGMVVQLQKGVPLTQEQAVALSAMAAEVRNLKGPIDQATKSVQNYGNAVGNVPTFTPPPPPPPVPPTVINSLIEFSVSVKDAADAMVTAAQTTTGVYIAALTALSLAAKEGLVPLKEQAAAAAALAQAAASGVPGLKEHQAVLEAMAAQLKQGVPLTKEQAAALEEMALSTVDANRAALGLESAMSALNKQAAATNAQIREIYITLTNLTHQLAEGAVVTSTQAAALRELAQRAKEGNGFTADMAKTAQNLANSLTAGAKVTKEQVTDLRNLTQGYAETNKAALGLRDATEEQKGALEGLSSSAQALLTVLIALGVAGFKNLLDEAGRLAARVETLGVVMSVMAKNAGLSSDDLRIQVETITRLGITTQEATDAVIKFVQAQLKISDAAKLARAAQDLAVVAGINSSQAFERLTHAIESQSIIMLRQFGIVTGLHQIYDKYAEQVGKTVKQLDEIDKKQAVLNLILREGEKVAGAYEQAMGTTGKQLTSFARYVEEAKLKLGEGLVPVFGVAIRVATELLAIWIKLPPVIQTWVSATAAATTVMAALLTVMAAGKWLGIAAAFIQLKEAVQLFFLAVAEGEGIVGAASLAFGALNIWLVAIVAVIGVASAAWIAYSKSQEIAIDADLKHAAQRETDIKAIQTQALILAESSYAVAKAEKDLAAETGATKAEQDKQAVTLAELNTQQERYNRAVSSLTQLAPEAVSAIRSQATAYQDVAEALQKIIERKRTEAVLSLRGAQEGLAESERQQEAAAAALKTAGDRLDLLQKEKARLQEAAKAGREYVQSTVISGTPEGVVKTATALAQVTKALDSAKGSVRETGKAFDAATGQTDRFRQQVTDLDNALHPEKLRQYNADAVAVDFSKAKEQYKNLSQMVRQAGKDIKFLSEAPDVATFRERLRKVEDSWADHTKELEKEAESARKAMKKLREDILGTATVPTAQWEELQRLLNETGLTAEEYGRRLNAARSILEKFGKQSDEVKDKFPALQKNLENLQLGKYLSLTLDQVQSFQSLNTALIIAGEGTAEYDAVLKQNAKTIYAYNGLTEQQLAQVGQVPEVAKNAAAALEAMDQKFRDLQEADLRKLTDKFGEEMVKRREELNEQNLQADIAAARERVDLAHRVALQIEDMDRNIFEQRGLAYAHDVDKAIYQEKRRAEEMERSIKEEARARNEAIQASREAVEARLRQGAREIEQTIALMELERIRTRERIRDAVETAKATPGQSDQVKQLESQLRAFDDAATQFQEKMQQYREDRMKLLNEEAAAESERLDQQQANADAATKAQLEALERQKVASAATIKDILRQYNTLRNVGIEVYSDIVDTALSGFEQMITGAKSFKDVMLDIFKSLLSTATNLVNQIVSTFVKGLAGIGTAPGVSGLAGAQQAVGGFLGKAGMFGTGAAAAGAAGGGAAAAATPAVGFVEGAGGGAAAGAGIGTFAAVGIGAAGAGAGGLAGYAVGSQFGSRAAGGAAGAAAGAGTGALIGTLIMPGIGTVIGAATGGIAGLIGGIIGGGKEAREVEKIRQAYFDSKGGIEALKTAAGPAQAAVEKLLSTKKVAEFNKALAEINLSMLQQSFIKAQGGIETLTNKANAAGISLKGALSLGGDAEKATKALELVKAKLDLIDKAGGLENLRKQAQLVGFDLKKAFEAKTVEEFNAAVEELNALLEESRKKLENLTNAAQGLQLMTEGLAGRIERLIKDFKLRPEDIGNFGDLGLDPELTKRLQGVQDEFNRIGRTAAWVFANILRQTGDIVAAMNAISPTLDALIELQKKYGLAADESFATLLHFREVVTANEDVAKSIAGAKMAIEGLGQAGLLSTQNFLDLSASVRDSYQTLIDRGVEAKDALLLSQPALQALWEAQQKYHFETDAATQALLDQAEEQGVIGAKYKDINEKILDVLVAIAIALNAVIPEAYENASNAAGHFRDNANRDMDDVRDHGRTRLGELEESGARAYRNTASASQTSAATQNGAHDSVAANAGNRYSQVAASGQTAYNANATAAQTSAGTQQGTFDQTSVVAKNKYDKVAIDAKTAYDQAELAARTSAGGQQAATATTVEEAQKQYEKYRHDVEIAYNAGAQAAKDSADKQTGHIRYVGGEIDTVTGKMHFLIRTTHEFGDEAVDAGRRAEDAFKHVGDGHSPSGIKHVINRLREMQNVMRQTRDVFLSSARDMEEGIPDLGATAVRGQNGKAPQVVQVNVTYDGRSEFTVNGTKLAPTEVWNELKPQVENHMQNNTGQFAKKIADATKKYAS